MLCRGSVARAGINSTCQYKKRRTADPRGALDAAGELRAARRDRRRAGHRAEPVRAQRHGQGPFHAHAPLRGLRRPHRLQVRLRLHRVRLVPPRVTPDVLRAHPGGVPGLRGRHPGDHVPAGGEQEGHAGVPGGDGGGVQRGAAGLHAGQQRRRDGEGRFAGEGT